MKIISGIYCIENTINNKKYIGLSKNCMKRWYDHRQVAKSPIKECDKRKPLYNAIRKYGLENFIFYILEECEISELKEKEKFWIAKLNTYDEGYNATRGGDLPTGKPLKGEEHGMHKLTEDDVIKCRQYYASGLRARDIYEKYYSNLMSFEGFQRMWHGSTWKHIMPEVFNNKTNPKQKLTNDIVKHIKLMFKEGATCAQVYHYYNEIYSRTTINDIYHNRRYKEIN